MGVEGASTGGGDAVDDGRRRHVQGVGVAGRRRAQNALELGEGHLDGVEVRRVGGQETQLAAGGFNGLPCRRTLVRTEVVEDDDLPACASV